MNARIPLRKTHAAAFTLIELLTVIAIIAVLMGLLFPAISGAKEQARRADAKSSILNIVNACKMYETDYGKFPPVSQAQVGKVDTSDSNNGFYSYGDTGKGKCAAPNNYLFDILRAIPNTTSNNAHAMNKRQQKYIETKLATDYKNPRNGFTDGSNFTGVKGQYMDPWGAQYCIVLDATGSGTLSVGRFYSDLSDPINLLRVSAAGFSMGKDNNLGGKGYEGKLRKPSSNEAPDDVVSWQ